MYFIDLKRAVYDKDRGMGAYEAEIEEDALDFLAELSGGDAFIMSILQMNRNG